MTFQERVYTSPQLPYKPIGTERVAYTMARMTQYAGMRETVAALLNTYVFYEGFDTLKITRNGNYEIWTKDGTMRLIRKKDTQGKNYLRLLFGLKITY